MLTIAHIWKCDLCGRTETKSWDAWPDMCIGLVPPLTWTLMPKSAKSGDAFSIVQTIAVCPDHKIVVDPKEPTDG